VESITRPFAADPVQSRAPISARLVANMLQTAGANRKLGIIDISLNTADLSQTL
jgi:hypothetical protein